MRLPDAAKLLDVWEEGLRQPLQRQVLTLLAAALPELDAEQLAELSIGRRDALLLDLRERLFGPDLAAVAACPNCGEKLEANFPVSSIRAAPNAAAAAVAVESGDYNIAARLPTTNDLLAIPRAAGAAVARNFLLERCLVEVRGAGGRVIERRELPDAAVARIVAQMAEAEPQADIELALNCPACSHTWHAAFDIAGFLIKEIHAWAQRMLRDVQGLARAYGWSEANVLALSPLRRRIYLELAGP
jgi:uncharacterized protein (UPF0212 family)